MGPTANMKYLEDYVDTIEALPLELQRNFSLIRELDALSQDKMNAMENEVMRFTERVRELDPDARNVWLRQILASFEETAKHGEEKLALATQTYDTVDRHIRRLDDDLVRFEEEQLVSPKVPSAIGGTANSLKKRQKKGEASSVSTSNFVGGGSNPSGTMSGTKRTASGSDTPTKKKGKVNPPSRPSSTQKQKSTPSSARSNSSANNSQQKNTAIAASRDRAVQLSESSDMPIDPNEPTYCFCEQVSFGEMVACDDPDCEIEWFHFGCVGLKQLPKGKWFCANCRKNKK